MDETAMRLLRVRLRSSMGEKSALDMAGILLYTKNSAILPVSTTTHILAAALKAAD
jgi:hypothetical protein